MNITLNPNYVLKNDDGCVLLIGKRLLPDNEASEDSVLSVIHPFHAMILSFVNGDDYDVILDRASDQLQVSRDKIKKFIDSLIENKTHIGPAYKDVHIGFPKHTIIKSDFKRLESYKVEDFAYNHVDVRMKRHKTPSHVIFMLNNKCVTDCIYCYADKRIPTECKIPFERFTEIIAEAKKLDVVNLNLIGGEVFLYKHWKKLVKLCLDYDYDPNLSTKYPLSEDDVKYLATLNISYLQISLDTMIPEHLKQILCVNNDYIEKMKKTFEYLKKHKVPTVVHTILNSKNSTTEDMISIYDFLKQFDNIKFWMPECVSASIYIKNFDLYKANTNNIAQLQECIENLKEISKFNIINGLYNVIVGSNNENTNSQITENKSISEWIKTKGVCTANLSGFQVLPTGDVTLCEQLYWHPKFIIGNVLTQSLEEIWNSEKAKSLFYIKQSEFHDDSACASCEEFNECRYPKQVCYRDLIKVYGNDKWYYPDVNCPKAPKPIYNIKY